MNWVLIIVASLIVAVIAALIVSRLERRKGDRRIYQDTEAWIERNSEKQAMSGFTYEPHPRAGFGNDTPPEE